MWPAFVEESQDHMVILLPPPPLLHILPLPPLLLQETLGLLLFYQVSPQTILGVLLLHVCQILLIFLSNLFLTIHSIKSPIPLHKVFSFLHKFLCLFFFHIWSTFVFWVDTH